MRNGNVEAGNSFALRVLRPTDQSETAFALVGTSAPQLVPDSNDLVRGPFPAGIPVRAGDRIGLQSRGPFNFGVPVALTGQSDGARFFMPDLADGMSGVPSDAGNSGQVVLVPAQIDEASPPPPPPPPSPGFTLGLLGNVTTSFAMKPTGSVTIPLVVRRNDLSRGPIRLSVAGVPAGLEGIFQALQADVPGDVADPLVVRRSKAVRAPAVQPGSYKLTVTGTPLSASAGAAAQTLALTLVVTGQLQVHVHGIEVTQAVQTIGQPESGTYRGVPLVTRKKTVAKVFVGFTGAEASGKPNRPPLGVTLSGFDSGGHELPFSPLVPEWSPPVNSLARTAGVFPGDFLTNERVSQIAYTFVLPDTWTKRSPVTLVAKAVSSSLAGPGTEICSDDVCGATPSARLSAVPFRRNPAPWTLNVIGLITYDSMSGKLLGVPGPPAAALAKLQALSPVPFRFLEADGTPTIYPVYRAVWSATNDQLWEAARDFDNDVGHAGDGTLGLFVYGPGAGVTMENRISVATVDLDSAGNVNRPVTVAAHEVLHELGLQHADAVVGGCGGNGDGKPDAVGHLRSVGTDLSGSPPYRVIADTVLTPAWDLMSYCNITSGDPRHWISELNWDRLLGAPTPFRSAARAVARGGLTVAAAVDPAGAVRIFSVGSTPSAGAGSPSPYTLVGHAADGTIVGSAPMRQASASDPGAVATVLEGAVAGRGIARVEIVAGGAVVAARDRSAHPPTAAFLSPRKGARVSGPLTVRWRASDADADRLRFTLGYSADGRTFHDVAGGPAGGRVRIPAAMLAASKRARLRLRVSDGFAETAVASPPFAIAPRRPAVTILQPLPDGRFAGGSLVFLSGGATDYRGHRLVGARLRWLARGKTLGFGEQLTAAIPAGAREIRLVASDAAGRTGSASVRIRAPASMPFFTRLTAPPTLSRRARRMTLVVATTQAALVRVAGRRFKVGRAVRRIHVPVRPGRETLTLRLTLTSAGKSTHRVVTVRRR